MRLTFTRECRLLKWALGLVLLLPVFAQGQISIAPGGNIAQDFNTVVATSPTATLPTGWFVSKNNGVRTVTGYPATAATELSGSNNISSSASNGIYNFGDGTVASDRAIGGISSSSSSKTVNLYTQLKNTGSADITSFTISYDVEQYRNGQNAEGFWIKLYYSANGTNWTAAGNNFETVVGPNPNNNGYTPAPGNVFKVTGMTLPVTVAQNSVLYLAWSYSVASGSTTSSAPALGVDNISITANGGVVTPNPVPVLTSISPNTAVANSANFTLTVTGSNFLNSSNINFNGVAKATTYVSATQLTTTINSADIASAGTVPVTVTNPAPGGGTTTALNFTVTAPPTALSIVAGGTVSQDFSSIGTSATASTPFGWYLGKDNSAVRTVGAFSSAVSATEFRGGNGASSSGGIYNFGAGDAASATDRAVGGLSSGSAAKSVNLYSHLENTGTAGIAAFEISYDVEKYRNGTNSAGFSIQLYYSTNGTNWASAGADFATAFPADADNFGFTPAPGASVAVANKLLNVPVSAGGQLYLAWNYSVTSGATTSNAQALAVDNITIKALANNPVPVISFISPNSTTAGSPGFTLTVNGTGFINNSEVNFNGSAVATTFVSTTQLTAAIANTDVAVAGTMPVTVTNPAPGGGTSNAVNFTVTPSIVPAISVSGGLLPFITTAGTATAPQTYEVAGSSLTNQITITAPVGFLISENAGSGYGSSLALVPVNGTVMPTTIYVIFYPSAAGSVSGNLVHSSNGAVIRNVAVSGNALSSQPTSQAAISFGAVTASSIVVNLSGGNGQKNLVLVREGGAVNATPADGTTYAASSVFGSGAELGSGNYAVISGSGNSVTLTGLKAATTYYFAVFAFNDDTSSSSENYLTTSPGTGNKTTGLPAATTYTWNVGSGNWSNASSWSPNRTSPAVNDILIFNGAVQSNPAVTLDFSSPITIGQLKFINSTNPTFSASAGRTIAIDNDVAGTDFLVDANSHLMFSNTSAGAIAIQITEGETGQVYGDITFRGTGTTAHRLTAGDNNSLVFESGSSFVTGTGFGGNAFGTTSLNSVWFKDGSTYVHGGGNNPFGAGAPNSVVTFADNSLYQVTINNSPSLSGRTYGNLEFNNPAFAQSLTGGNPFTVNNLVVTSATTLNLNLTGGIVIAGDLQVESGAVGFAPNSSTANVEIKGDLLLNGGSVTFNPTQANSNFLVFSGTGTQTISGPGTITIGNNATTTVATGSALSLQRNFSIGANLVVDGSFTMAPLATITFNGTAARTVGGTGTILFSNMTVGSSGIGLNNALQVSRLLTLNGNLTTNARTFTLLSNADGTAMVVNSGGAVIGTATMQRYIEPSLNSGLGYRHYSSPVVSTTVRDLATTGFAPVVNTAYNTSVKPSAVKPFPTIFSYNQSRLNNDSARFADFNFGWESPASLNAPLVPGRGYTVNIGASRTVDFNGTLNNGTVNAGILTRGATASSGWHLLGNPYPAPIDWDLMTLPGGIDNAVYVFRSNSRYAGQYVSYVNGIGGTGAELIPAMQGFFVRVNSGSPTFAFSNAARLTTYADPGFYRLAKTADTRPLLQLNLKNAAGNADELYIYQQAGATLNDDAAFDAYKIEGNGPQVPTLYALTPNGNALSISGLPVLTQETVIPLGFSVGAGGYYSFEAVQLTNFPMSVDVLLEDKQQGTVQNLRSNPVYSCQLAAGGNATRFVLRLRPDARISATADVLNAALKEALIFPNPATSVQGFTLRVGGLKNEKVYASLYNQLGQLLESRVLVPANGMVEEKFSGKQLPKGIYTLKLVTATGQVSKKVILQ